MRTSRHLLLPALLVGFASLADAQVAGPTGWTSPSGVALAADLGDLNGDGFRDFGTVALTTSIGVGHVHFGAADGLSATPDVVFTGPFDSSPVLAGAGDVNLDGFDDLLLADPLSDGASGTKTDTGVVHLYFGSPSGPSATPDWTWESGFSTNETGTSMAAADVDGDGYSDILIGAPHWNAPDSNSGAVHVFRGSPTGPASTPDRTYQGFAGGSRYGESVAAVGDMNGDGREDYAIGAPGADLVQLFYGSPASPTGVNEQLEASGSGERFGAAVAGVGDVDGDGFDDLAIGSPLFNGGRGRAAVHRGRFVGVEQTAVWIANGPDLSSGFGTALAPAGDFNGDGFDDLLVGAPNAAFGGNNSGRVELYLGTSTGIVGGSGDDCEPIWTATGSTQQRLGTAVGALDTDGDGVRELFAASGVQFTNLGTEQFANVDVLNPPTWPGTGGDLRLMTAVGEDGVPNELESLRVAPGSRVGLSVDSPDGGLVGLPLVTGLEVHQNGAWGGPFPGFFSPDLQINPITGAFFSLWSVPALPANGAELSFDLPPSAASLGRTWRLQTIALDLGAPNGLFWSSDAVEWVFPIAAVYVDGASGDDANAGESPAEPLATIAAALQRACTVEFAGFTPEVRVADTVVYEETLFIDEPVSISGGWNAAFTTQPAGALTRIDGGARAVTLFQIDAPMRLERLDVRAADGNLNVTSIALELRDCGDFVEVVDCELYAGRGGDGLDGSGLTGNASNGAAGGNGESVLDVFSTFAPDGGSGGSNGGSGFAGGRGGNGRFAPASGEDGSAGSGPCAAAGGAGKLPIPFVGGADGDTGLDGDDGSNGANGTAPSGALAVSGSGGLSVTRGTSGTSGVGGCGGGGGGAGAGFYTTSIPTLLVPGSAGGGGGQGGNAGGGGDGGFSGGSSIATFLWNSDVRFDGCYFQSDSGGNGGRGGDGGGGGFGGAGGIGGFSLNIDVPLGPLTLGVGIGGGGDGGVGGRGGGGGGGGGGRGGDSFCILRAGGSEAEVTNSTFQVGPGGSGGPGGAQGNTGDLAQNGDDGKQSENGSL